MKHFYQHIIRILLFTVLCLLIIKDVYADLPYNITCSNVITAPKYSYEGHFFTVKNSSVFHLEGEYFQDISDAISKGYAVCSWEESADAKKDIVTESGYIIEQKLRYSSPKEANIKLIQTWVKESIYGIQNESTVNVTVRQCPYLDSAVFSGEQRAYQKQKLALHIAQHPDYPIDLNSIKISILDSSGNIVEYHRAPVISVDDENYFVDVSLEFLTKNSSSEYFSYNIKCSDSRGQSIDITKSFYVAKDQAPKASIDMKLKFYRQQGGGPAVITAKSNGKYTDDEVTLTWDVPGGTYTDNSGGANSSISFELASTGRYQITLYAKDNWQDTLEEFVTDAERKTSSITVNFKVDNIAPVIGIGKTVKTLELLLINSGLDDGSLISTLLESGVKATVYHAEADIDEVKDQLALQGSISGSESSLFDDHLKYQKAASIDSKYLFKFVSDNVSDESVGGPYSIYRYDLENPNADPTVFTIPESSLPAASTEADIYLGRDLQEQLLYICMGANTVIIDKGSGYIYPTVNMMLGKENIVLGSYVYSLTESGIYKVNLADGSFALFSELALVSGSDTNARIYKGNAIFVVKDGTDIKLAKFDLENETLNLTTLFTAASKNFLVAITPRGRVVLNAQEGAVSTVYSFENSGAQQHSPLTIKICALYKSNTLNAICAVYDCSGEVNFVYTAKATANGAKATVSLYKLDGTTYNTVQSTAKTYYSLLLGGWQYSDGTVIVMTGCNYCSSAKGTSSWVYKFNTKETSVSSYPSMPYKAEWSVRCNDTVVLGNGYVGTTSMSMYRFNEGYEYKCERIALETLNFKSQYQERCSSEDLDTVVAACLAKCGVTSSESSTPSARHYSIGETVSISDFNIVATDYENDTIKAGTNSLGLPRSFSQAGKYSFNYYVTDDTGNSEFNYKSSSIKLTFYVDLDDDTPTEEEPEDEGSSGQQQSQLNQKIYILHRKY